MSRPVTRSSSKRSPAPDADDQTIATSAQRPRLSDDSATSGSSASVASVALPIAIAQTLHADALHSIIAFLPMKDLPMILQTCFAWKHAAMSEKSRHYTVTIKQESAHFGSLLRSPLNHLHVRHLTVTFNKVPGLIPTLMHIRMHQPLLDELKVEFKFDDKAKGPLLPVAQTQLRTAFLQGAFHPNLVELHLHHMSGGVMQRDDSLQLMIDSLPSASGLQELCMAYMGPGKAVRWDSLLQLRALKSFTQNGSLTREQCAIFKQMSLLEALHAPVDEEGLQALLSPPHSLEQLSCLDLRDCVVGAPLVELLVAQVPKLATLKPRRLLSDAVPLLPLLARLHVISLAGYIPSAAELPVLVASLRALAELHELIVHVGEHWDTKDRSTDVYLETLLRAVPKLTSLSIGEYTESRATLHDISFLALAPGLTKLHFGALIYFAHAEQLLQLGKMLTSLHTISFPCAPSMKVTVFEKLFPPSKIVPSLQRLEIGDSAIQMMDGIGVPVGNIEHMLK